MWSIVKESATNWRVHRNGRQGAALAYYSIFSLGPIAIIATAVASAFFDSAAVHDEVAVTLSSLLGERGAEAVQTMLAGAFHPTDSLLASAIGIGTLLFAAVGLVVQLKDALNIVWEVENRQQSGVWGFARTYVLSLAAVISVGFLLLISLVLTTTVAAIAKYYATYMPEALLQSFGFGSSFLVTAALFAMIFKFLPDTEVRWRDVWLGAIATAVLFEIGKFLIGFYIGKQGLESSFGAAASLVVVLIWVYYSAQIVLMGAEFTRAYASHPNPSQRAVLNSHRQR